MKFRPRCLLFISRSMACAFLASGLILGAPGPSCGQISEIGTVYPKEFDPLPIAVPPFAVSGGKALQGQAISEIIAHDLMLSGFFKLPENPQFVRELHQLDRQDGVIHFKDWYRAGVLNVVKGKYTIKGDRIEAEVRTWDPSNGSFIFGKRYIKYRVSEARRMAHYISNDIIQRLTTYPGVANTKLLFVRQAGRSKGRLVKEIYMMDADGRNVRKMTNDLSLAATPAWGANGTEIYYTTYRDYNPDLAGLFVDGSRSWYVSRRPGFNLSPDWSFKRQMIALTLTKDGNSEIYLMNRFGKKLKRLTYNRAIDSSPNWSPDGTQIAFTSDRYGSPHIFIMDDSGITIRQLTFDQKYNDAVTWSPNGDRLAFCSRIDGIFQIFTIEPNGNNLRQLTHAPYNCEDPIWSPNGWTIAFTAEKGNKKQIHLMFSDGRFLAQLTNGANSYSSAWSPIIK